MLSSHEQVSIALVKALFKLEPADLSEFLDQLRHSTAMQEPLESETVCAKLQTVAQLAARGQNRNYVPTPNDLEARGRSPFVHLSDLLILAMLNANKVG